MIAIIDYGMGNLHSVKNALDYLNVESIVTGSAEDIIKADKLILPGVGAFPDAADALEKNKLDRLITEQCRDGKPLLGICLGMQLLFEYGNEHSRRKGLGLIEGEVVLIDGKGEKIPHIGWNSLSIRKEDAVLNGVENGAYVYFVHSYRAETASDNVPAYTEYGEEIPALVKNPILPVYGAQFHPEKSHNTGLKMLKNFSDLK